MRNPLEILVGADDKSPKANNTSFRWATVTNGNPLRIRLDTDTDPIDATPLTLVSNLSAGDRVFVLRIGRRTVVLGRGGGTQSVNPGSTAEQIVKATLGTSVRDGLLAKLNSSLLNTSERCVVVVTGSSTFRGGSVRIGATERLAYLAGSPTFPLLETFIGRPNSGMQWIQGAVGGTTSANYLSSSALNTIDTVDPDYVIHGVGSNDYGNQVAINTYKANLRSKLERIEGDVPGVVNILVHQQARSDNTSRSITWDQYGTAMREVAEENESSRLFIDADALLNTYMFHEQGNKFDFVISDNIHMNDKGYKLLAHALGDSLGIPRTPHSANEFYDPTLPGSATYSSQTSTSLASVSIPSARYPRILTASYNGFARYSTGQAHMRVEAPGAGGAFTYRLTPDGVDHGVAFTRDFYLPPNQPTTVSLIVQAGAGSVYVSGAAGYAYFTVEEKPY